MLGTAFTTERLLLRPWQKNDADRLYAIASDERVGLPCGWQPHQSIEESRQIIETILSEEGTYAIVESATNQVVGAFSLRAEGASDLVEDDAHEREVGFWLGVDSWGKGYIPELVAHVAEHLFTQTPITTLWAGYFEGNDKSKRVQEKCGFQSVGIREQHYVRPLDKCVTLHITQLKKI
ncbi:GNAT family N-acetyltransferase [Aerococcaceae bacterium NML190938]|nr:GNAT family N-acetyltransferase [Aerococcaceae bacterium NML190938]